MWRHYVYSHIRADDGSVFYIGKGTIKSKHRHQVFDRAHDKDSRNVKWQRIVAKHGFTVQILASCLSDEYAQELERKLIAEYGRANLANLTDGGDGCAGIDPSPEARRKLSEAAKRKRSEAWIKSIRLARQNGGNGGVVKHGDKLPELWRTNIAATKQGSLNPMYGRTGALHPTARKVRDTASGNIYDSVVAAAASHGFKWKTLYNWLSGHRPNPTNLEFHDGLL